MNLMDRHAGDFTQAMINYQNCHHFDFVKVTSNPQYMPEAMGSVLRLPRSADETAF